MLDVLVPPWLVMVGVTMSAPYGLFDLAEDMVLFLLMDRLRVVQASDAMAASTFTIGKMLAVSLSVFGIAIFVALSVLTMRVERII